MIQESEETILKIHKNLYTSVTPTTVAQESCKEDTIKIPYNIR